MDFRDNLRRMRKAYGLTQEQLGDHLKEYGIRGGRTAVNNWERGRNEPSANALRTLATFFNVSIEELLGDSRAEAKESDMITRLAERLRERSEEEQAKVVCLACQSADRIDYMYRLCEEPPAKLALLDSLASTFNEEQIRLVGKLAKINPAKLNAILMLAGLDD